MPYGHPYDEFEYVPLVECVARGIYRLSSRNLTVGVYDGDEGFIGVREKFGSRYLFTEFHWDQGAPFGTVHPLELLGMLDESIELRETNDPVCGKENCGRAVKFTQTEEGAFGRGVWSHVDDDAPMCREGYAVSSIYMPLFEELEKFEE